MLKCPRCASNHVKHRLITISLRKGMYFYTCMNCSERFGGNEFLSERIRKRVLMKEVMMAYVAAGVAILIGKVGLQQAEVYRIYDEIWERGIENQLEKDTTLFYHRTLEEARANPYYAHLLDKLQ